MPEKLDHRTIEAIAATISQLPFVADYMLRRMQVVEDKAGEVTDIAATDGKAVYLTPKFWEFSLPRRLFICGHEVYHAVMQHPEQMKYYIERNAGPLGLPWYPKIYHTAADLWVNAHLVADNVGERPPSALYDSAIDPRSDTLEGIYEALYKWAKDQPDGFPGVPKQGDGQGEQGQGGKSGQEGPKSPAGGDKGRGQGKPPYDLSGEILDELREATAEQKLGDPEQAEAVQRALQTAAAQGKLPGSLREWVKPGEASKIRWQDELRDALQVIWEPMEITSERINRRRIVMPPRLAIPAVAGYALSELVIAVDTSGSISQSELSDFLAECSSIYDQLQPEICWLIWWDTQAHPIEIESSEDLEQAEAIGGGGTDYRCIPQMIADLELDPDAVICLTDGYARTPGEVPWEHITVTTGRPFPFGRNIELN